MRQQGTHRAVRLERTPRRPRFHADDLARRHGILLRVAGCVGWDWQVESGRVELEGDVARFGWEPGSVRTIRDLVERIHPEDRAMHQASLKQALVSGRGPYTSAFRVIRETDGRVLYVEDRGVVDWERDYGTLRVTGYLFEIEPRA